MPKELGKAKRADLAGSFPGEPSEQVSSLARFLESSGQLVAPEPGSFFGNGNGRHDHDTEMAPRMRDTEVGPPPPRNGNGHAPSSGDTVFDSPLAMESMEPEALAPEPLAPAAPAPAALKPSDTVVPELFAPEPQALESVPDLTSPELDEFAEEEGDGTQSAPKRGRLPTVKPEPHELPGASRDTGMLTMDAARLPASQRLTPDELKDHSEEETGHAEIGDTSEKITSKVEQRPDGTPARHADGVVRDTVNFYNQTQSLAQQRAAANAAKPGDSIRGTVPLGGAASPPAPVQAKPPAPALLPAPSLALTPDDLAPQELSAEDDLAAAQRKDTDRFQLDDRRPPELPMPEGTDKIDKEQAARERAAAGKEPMELDALAPERVAAGKDTQRFFVADLLSKKDSDPAAARSSDSTGQLEVEAQPLPATPADTSLDSGTEASPTVRETRPAPDALPEPTAVGGDFFAGLQVEASDRIVPEFEGTAVGVSSADESLFDEDEADETDRSELPPVRPGHVTERVLREAAGKVESAWQPAPAEQGKTAVPVPAKPETRLQPAAPAAKPAAAPAAAPAKPAAAAASSAPARASEPELGALAAAASASGPAGESGRSRRITDGLTRRLQEESAETQRLLSAAENVAQRLRAASEASRTDLVAISTRRRSAPLPAPEAPAPVAEAAAVPAPAATGGDEGSELRKLAEALEHRTQKLRAQVSARTGRVSATAAVTAPVKPPEAAAPASATQRQRVPTAAIGDLVAKIEEKVGRGSTLADLLDGAPQRPSQRVPKHSAADARILGAAAMPDAAGDPYADMDVDQLVAASAQLRSTVEAEQEQDRRSGRMPAAETPAPAASASGRLSTASQAAVGSPLAENLDRMWKDIGARKTGVLPAAQAARIASRDDVGLGWTQEALWKTLVGISGVTFLLGAFFVYLVYRLFS